MILGIIGILLALLDSGVTQSQPLDYGNNARAGTFYRVRGVSFYVEQYGSGAPLILLHGNGGSISSFSGIIPALSERYRVIAIDSRAHGKSTDASDSLSFDMMADDVEGLMDVMHLKTAYLLGWSDGGIVALSMALRHPERVLKLAATGANVWPDSTALIPSFWKEEQHIYDSVKQIPRVTKAEKNSWKLFLLDWKYPHFTLEQLHHIKTPSLIISGDHDLIRLEHTVLIYQHLPAGRLWVLPNSSHGTLIEYPDEFAKKVMAFFRE